MTRVKLIWGSVLTVVLILFVGFAYSPQADEPVVLQNPELKSELLAANPDVVTVSEVTVEEAVNPYVYAVVEEYGEFIRQAIQRGQAPGAAVAIIKDTSIIYLNAFGLKQVGTTDSIDIHTVFRLGSVSKSIASVLAGTLVDKQLIRWDDPIIHYYPEFQLKSPEHTQKVTVRHVLSHTTGLPYHAYTNMIEERIPLDTLLANLKSVSLFGEPGQIYSYQNVGYSLIEKVVENSTHESFEDALQEFVFEPLHMHNSSASYAAIIQNPNVARPHQYARKRWVPVKISDTYYNAAPAGGINASIADMALWLQALMSGSGVLMSDTTLQELFEPQVRAISKNRNFYRWKRPRASYYALGWRVINFPNETLLYHGGYVNGYRSEVAIDQKNRVAICVLINSPGALADISVPEFFKRYSAKADSINRWENRNHLLFVKNTEPKAPVLN